MESNTSLGTLKSEIIKINNIRFENHCVTADFFTDSSYKHKLCFCFDGGHLRIFSALADVNVIGRNTCVFEKKQENLFIYKDEESGNSMEILGEPLRFIIKNPDNKKVLEFSGESFSILTVLKGCEEKADKLKLSFKTDSRHYYGFGERFNRVDQAGLDPDIHVIEQYTNQQDKTYMPVPFFFTEKGYGMFINSSFYIKYRLPSKNNLLEIECKVNPESPLLDLYIFLGTPKEIIKQYQNITGYPALPPKWVFGPWMSSNRWNTQKETVKQVELTKKYGIPATVLVLEAWSDEATFYIFNDARYEAASGDKYFKYDDFTFDEEGKWPDPKGLVEYLHGNNLKLVLWQIPVIKYFDKVEIEQHLNDERYVIEKGYCVLNPDGTPYRIPRNWFAGSLVLDFTNPEAREWWFNKRRYLLEDLGVDGFKTDGGEFIHNEEACFYNGKKGREMRNRYPVDYISSYHSFLGKERVTFSRAGFAGSQKYPLYWAGDQESTFKELKSVFNAGLSINLSGNPFWGFDIAGFAGKMPSSELYIRSTQLAAFCPIMQYHAAPPEDSSNNDRTPWNVAEYNNDERVLSVYRKYANIRMNLLPYIYNEACHVSRSGEPFMKHLLVDYPEDSNVYNIEDEYLFGRSLLVAPVIEEGRTERQVYLPEGKWLDFWDCVKYDGNIWVQYPCGIEKVPVFIKYGSVIPMNLDDEFKLGGFVGNSTKEYSNLCFLITGMEEGAYVFADDLGNDILIKMEAQYLEVNLKGSIRKIYLMVPENEPIRINIEGRESRIVNLNNFICRLYEFDDEVTRVRIDREN